MPSSHESFFQNDTFAVVGHTEKKTFPKLTYNGLKTLGKKVYPVDASVPEIEGDQTYADLSSLPEKVDGVVLELPKSETCEWVEKAAEMGVKDVWIHMNCETPEAIQLAEEKGINLRTGTCAVMYVTPEFTFHSIHKWMRKMLGRY